MTNTLLYKDVNPDIKDNTNFKNLMGRIDAYTKKHHTSTFIISEPLVGDSSDYDYQYNSGFIILIPDHKLIFSTIDSIDTEEFEEYTSDFKDDLSALSKKYKHQQVIGRIREWQSLLVSCNIKDINDIDQFSLKGTEKKKASLLISLLTGSINDASRVGKDEPSDLLDAIKKRIVLFDADQTRFIYNDTPSKHQLTVQGLVGTGKTELLLHKLFGLYMNNQDNGTNRIVFTCFNKILANNMKKRIPEFFNFMKADQQIEWNKRLWVMRSWGSQISPNSGLYSFICNEYNIPFSKYEYGIDFNDLCKNALNELNKKNDFEPCFDYILIDEGQDFGDDFFKLCEKITTKKVIIASDIFQNIFDRTSKITHNPDFTLNKVYRTDPRNFMFAQLIGFGVKERPVINWLDDSTWKTCGYIINKFQNNRVYEFTREPLKRFDDIPHNDIKPLDISIKPSESLIDETIQIISDIIDKNVNVSPSDIGIVLLSGGKQMYDFADRLSIKILDQFDWETEKGYEIKDKSDNKLFISNKNNIKGLEFPFVICIANNQIQSDPSARNTLYMALTRSFITSYLVLSDINEGLMKKYDQMYKEIISNGTATVLKPTKSEIMNDQDRSILKQISLTQRQVVENILKDKKITDDKSQQKLINIVSILLGDDNDSAKIKKVIDTNLNMLEDK